MDVKCRHCSGKVTMKADKILLAVGGAAIMVPLAAAFGLKAGLIALICAAWGGNANAARLLQLKLRLMKESQRLGSFFHCSQCGKDAGIEEVFSQIL
jgi:DNA-directed RNA polymerase subunit RPC12/RpoP